ncbi:MAG: hypothetical protein ACTSYQ_03885 [Candidatus Odinarchaeia archaeon]
MTDIESTVNETLTYVRPNIERFKELKDLILPIVKNCKSDSEFLSKLNKLIERIEDVILRTDLKIFRIGFCKIAGLTKVGY